jgi:hypothetical protein
VWVQVAGRHAAFFQGPWQITIDGLVEEAMTVDVAELLAMFHMEERVYRHRCVEAWSIVVRPLALCVRAQLRWRLTTRRSQGKHCLRICMQSKPWRCSSNPSHHLRDPTSHGGARPGLHHGAAEAPPETRSELTPSL